ncbi:GAF domain-containing protein [Lyngbya sp. CCY1209]|jgi:hypothetical protein|uniref:GAF domain-containing protein n=1 Tax=Lyngbya sp. CCY1209 TaxID=2886103 RepID=UPI002D2108EA|nr:GAF domain-containing protein [Lyngbya sp. CCY1209]MEB3886850.1 GAF domain-containing protein [Lyngbya sp. CCY1209]
MPYKQYTLTPTRDPYSSTGIYIPIDIEDAIAELDKALSDTVKTELKAANNLFDYHFTLGEWMRQNWGLWLGSRLAQHFHDMNVLNPDLMSIFLLRSYQEHLNRPPETVETLLHSLENKRLTPDNFFRKVGEVAQKLVNCDRASFWLIDREKEEVRTKVVVNDKQKTVRVAIGQGLMGQVAESGEMIAIPFDFYKSSHPQVEAIKALDDRVFYRTCSTLTIPVRKASGELLGVMHLINKTQPGNFPPYHPETHPTAPERWRTSFNREDIAIIDRLNQTVSQLIDRVFY